MFAAEQHKIVIIASDQERRDYLRTIVSGWGFNPFTFENVCNCLDNILPVSPDLVICWPLALERCFRLINTLKVFNCHLPVLIISDEPRMTDFIRCNDFDGIIAVSPDLGSSQIKSAVNGLLDNKRNVENSRVCQLIVGNSPEMVRIKKMICELNRFDDAVNIQGEIGTGKELVARVIHNRFDGNGGHFIKISGSEVSSHHSSANLIEYISERLPATGLNEEVNRDGVNIGTLFFHEFAALPADHQTGLLQFFEKGGSIKTAKGEIRLRLIVSSSMPLRLLVDRGILRKDLFYRLNALQIEIPPLRERIDDLPLLTDFFTDKFCIDYGKSHYNLTAEFKEALHRYHWPGNVDELQNLVRMAVLYGNQDSIIARLSVENHIPENGRPRNRIADTYYQEEIADIRKYLRDSNHLSLKEIGNVFVARIEKKILKRVLERTNWNRKKAALMLDISYKSLLNKIKEYGLN